MADTSSNLNVLHELIETCGDGQTGYAHAAALVSNPELKAYFSGQVEERTLLLKELEAEVKRMGESDPDTSGSVAGVLHRTWFEAKTDIGLGDQAVVNSVERGEDAAKAAYEKALTARLPDNLCNIIRRQSKSVFAAHDYVRDFRDREKAA